eukprot:3936578-Rhodomonas_salina.2
MSRSRPIHMNGPASSASGSSGLYQKERERPPLLASKTGSVPTSAVVAYTGSSTTDQYRAPTSPSSLQPCPLAFTACGLPAASHAARSSSPRNSASPSPPSSTAPSGAPAAAPACQHTLSAPCLPACCALSTRHSPRCHHTHSHSHSRSLGQKRAPQGMSQRGQ